MKEEMYTLLNRGIWEFNNLPYEKDVVGCYWVFAIKYHLDRTIEWSKAWLVAKGILKLMV